VFFPVGNPTVSLLITFGTFGAIACSCRFLPSHSLLNPD